MQTQICTECKVEQSLSAFHKQLTKYRTKCKLCISKYSQSYFKTNHSRISKRLSNYHLTHLEQRHHNNEVYRKAGYGSYQAMKHRCLNPKNKHYINYGGRGITICQRWLDSFRNFMEDMGPKPTPKHTIDRIDSDGNYEPGNCRWATPKEQSKNKRAKT